MKKVTIHILWLLLACFTFNAHAYELGPTSPGKWGDPTFGTGATITWSLMETSVSCPLPAECPESATTPLSSFLPAGYQAEIQRAFDTWAAVANLTFINVTDGGAALGTETVGNIRIGALNIDDPLGVLAYAYYPPSNGGAWAGDMILDSSENWSIGSSGFDLFSIVLHELGHSLGLDHTDVEEAVMYPYYHGVISGLHADDIAGIQYIYGVAIVPLPMAVWLMLSGMGFLSLLVRRRAAG